MSVALLIGIGLAVEAKRVPADAVVTKGGAFYDVTWSVPTLAISPLPEIEWDWSESLGGEWSKSFGFDYVTDTLNDLQREAIGYVKEACVAAKVPCLCDLLDILALDLSLSVAASLSGSASVGFTVTPPKVEHGELRSSAESGFTVPLEATISSSEVKPHPGDPVALSLNLASGGVDAGLLNGEANGGYLEVHGNLEAGVSFETPIKTFSFEVPGQAFTFEAGAGTGAQEIKDSGISVTIADLNLEEARLDSGVITSSDGPLYRISADLDKIAVILAGKYCTKKIDDPEIPAKDKKKYEDIQKILDKFDSAEGMTLKFDEYGVSFTLDVVKAQLDVDANVEREAKVGSVRPESITYSFDEPVVYQGELVAEVAVEGGQALEPPPSVFVSRGSNSETITVTPTVEFALDVVQQLSIVPEFGLTLEAGVLRDVKIGGETSWGDLWPSWPRWTSCIPLPIGTCNIKVPKTVCDAYGRVCDLYGNICDEYGDICDETSEKYCGFFSFFCGWVCTASHWGCTASHWGCRKSHWGCTATRRVVDEVLSHMCPVYVTLPSIPLPSFDLPDITLLPEIALPIPEIPGLELYSDSRTDTLTATMDLEPFEIQIGRDLEFGELSGSPALVGDECIVRGRFTDRNPSNDSWTVTLDYGDGTPIATLLISDTTFVAEHTYLLSGKYTIRAKVYDAEESSLERTCEVTVSPKLAEVSISTSNRSDEYCTIGDTVTLTFTACEKLNRRPEVEIGRSDAKVLYQGSNRYIASCVMDTSTREGEINFEIAFVDTRGNAGVTEETTDGSHMSFDGRAPEFDGCPSHIYAGEAVVYWEEPQPWDNGSGVAIVYQNRHPGDTFPPGTTTVGYAATDNVGLIGTCEFDVTVDPGRRPTVTVDQAPQQSDPTSLSPIVFRAVFSEQVWDFGDDWDVVIGGTAGASDVSISSTDGVEYWIEVSGMSGSGTVTVTIPENVAWIFDENGCQAGYWNRASTSTDNEVTYSP